MRCADVMHAHVQICGVNQTAAECAQLMRDKNIGFVAVVDNFERVRGIVTERDLLQRVLAAEAAAETPVGQLMRSDVVLCRPEDTLPRLRAQLLTASLPVAVVVNDAGRCVGLLRLGDLDGLTDETRRESEYVEVVRLHHRRRATD